MEGSAGACGTYADKVREVRITLNRVQRQVCAIQIFGTIVFTGSEIWEGFPNIPTDFEMTFEQDKVIDIYCSVMC